MGRTGLARSLSIGVGRSGMVAFVLAVCSATANKPLEFGAVISGADFGGNPKSRDIYWAENVYCHECLLYRTLYTSTTRHLLPSLASATCQLVIEAVEQRTPPSGIFQQRRVDSAGWYPDVAND